jgi:hypothetical protein
MSYPTKSRYRIVEDREDEFHIEVFGVEVTGNWCWHRTNPVWYHADQTGEAFKLSGSKPICRTFRSYDEAIQQINIWQGKTYPIVHYID